MSDTESISALQTQADVEAANRLETLANTASDKQTRKEARRALHSLRMKGIIPTESILPTPVGGKALEPVRFYASMIDGAGNRLFWVVLPDFYGGNPMLLSLLCDDTSGIRDFFSVRILKSDLKRRLTEMTENHDIAYVEVEPEFARWGIAQMREVNYRNRMPTADGFIEYAERIGAPEQAHDHPPVYAELNAQSLHDDGSFSHDPEDLFKLGWFEPWFFEAHEVNDWLDDWANVDAPDTISTGEEKERRREEILAAAITALMSPEMQARYEQRLEWTADILHRKGETDAARMALLHAVALAESDDVTLNPFARELVKRTFGVAMAFVANAPPGTPKQAPHIIRIS